MKITFLEVEPTDKETVKSTFPGAQIFSHTLKEDEIIEKCKDSEVICVFIYSPLTKKVINALPNLKLIVTRSVGYDHIDLKAAKKKNIPVCNVPDYGAHVIAEHVFALLLSTIRCIKEGDDRVEQCIFDFHGLRGKALKGKTLGIVGTGKIGQNVARIASMGFLMDVIAYDPFPNKEAAREYHYNYVQSITDIWEQSDVITLHSPLLDTTKHMINKDSIIQMKPGTILINTARGGLINTKDLIWGIKQHIIGYCALDVLEHEGNIEEDRELINLPQVVTTPHIAFYADDSMKKMYDEAFATIHRYANREDLLHRIQGI